MSADQKFSTLPQALELIEQVSAQGAVQAPGPWTWAQTLVHCAQSIEYSLKGFPRLRSAIIRGTVGKLVGRKFLRQGFFHHDRGAPIPGAPSLDDVSDPNAALDRLRAAIESFAAHEEPLAPHFIFGQLSKVDFERIHAMHIADHLPSDEPRGSRHKR